MRKNYGQLFEKIMLRIKEEQRIAAVKRIMVVSFVVAAGSIAAFIPVFNAMRASLYDSGFISSFSLIFSDFGVVLSYWQNFSLSLLETFPVLEFVEVLSVSLVFFISVNFIIKSIRYISEFSKINYQLKLSK
jgi:membrane protein CcdC involved in cytochrome C biogenesis